MANKFHPRRDKKKQILWERNNTDFVICPFYYNMSFYQKLFKTGGHNVSHYV